MITSVAAAKAFDKIFHPFIIKNIHQTRNERELAPPGKGHLEKPQR